MISQGSGEKVGCFQFEALWHGRGDQCGCAMLQLPGSSLGATLSDGCQEGCEEGREEVTAQGHGGSQLVAVEWSCAVVISCEFVVARA